MEKILLIGLGFMLGISLQYYFNAWGYMIKTACFGLFDGKRILKTNGKLLGEIDVHGNLDFKQNEDIKTYDVKDFSSFALKGLLEGKDETVTIKEGSYSVGVNFKIKLREKSV